MYDFLSENSIFVVLVVALIIWFGIFIYLNFIDRKISKIEKQLNLKQTTEEDKNE